MSRRKKFWFSVRMAFEIRVSNQRIAWEDRIVLIQASTDKEMRRKALRYAKKAKISYKNTDGAAVTWRFKDIVDDNWLDERPNDGSEVWWAFANPMTWESYKRKLKFRGLKNAT